MLYEIPVLKHINVKDTKVAISWLRDYGIKAKVIAGGTDLLPLIKDNLESPELLVNIKKIERMNRIDYDEKTGLTIGATVSLREILSSKIINEEYPLLSSAARQVGTTQIRNMGTLGGNILQRPQCMYFRSPDFNCRKKGQKRCYAIAGEHRDYHAIFDHGKCIMAHPSDMAPALVALGAEAIVESIEGERSIKLKQLFLGANHIKETILKPDELLLGFRVPNSKSLSFQVFLKHRVRGSFDFALASVAVAASVSAGVCVRAKFVFGGVAPVPFEPQFLVGAIQGKKLSSEVALQAAEESIEGARPFPMNRYKIEVVKGLVEKAILGMMK